MDEDLTRAYCIDAPTDRALRALYKQKLHAREASGTHNDAYFNAHVSPISCSTLALARPIGTFHLVLQGGRVTHATDAHSDRGNTRLMSLCTDLSLRATGPTQFEATVRDYVPAQDLRMLIDHR